jgi:phosphatidate cytidylyltransferase
MSNLLKRVLVGAFGVPFLLFAAIHSGWPLYATIVLLQAGALWEWLRLGRAQGAKPNSVGIAIAVVGLDAFVFTHGRPEAVAGSVIALSVMLLLDVIRRVRRPLRDLSAAMFFVGYVAVPFALWSVLHVPPGAKRWEPMGPLAGLFVATWVCDTAAYFIGKSFGRHKLDVAASPNKTVEGFVAGLVFGALVLPVLAAFKLVYPSTLDYVILPLIVGLAGQMGDLLESLLKREAQLKDTSAILPGHGGVLDRFDSLILSSPLLFAYLVLSSA